MDLIGKMYYLIRIFAKAVLSFTFVFSGLSNSSEQIGMILPRCADESRNESVRKKFITFVKQSDSSGLVTDFMKNLIAIGDLETITNIMVHHAFFTLTVLPESLTDRQNVLLYKDLVQFVSNHATDDGCRIFALIAAETAAKKDSNPFISACFKMMSASANHEGEPPGKVHSVEEVLRGSGMDELNVGWMKFICGFNVPFIAKDIRCVADVRKKDDRWLEDAHNFIQVIFPNLKRGVDNKELFLSSNRNGTTMLQRLEKIFAGDKEVRPMIAINMCLNVHRMLGFWGFKFALDGKEEPYIEYIDNHTWPTGHNMLRITRVLIALQLFGLEAIYGLFLACLRECGSKHVQQETIDFWNDTMGKYRRI
ncbi:MAG: hypothetical protein LBT03_02010 [Holosporales bacterium]|jgi:hypothetical protein|nr:hypothetical protein [Holosporales bacterium]